MKKLFLRYVAAAYPITNQLMEECETDATTLRELIEELDGRYGGFCEMFVDAGSGKLTLNTMIYYGEEGKVPVAVLDIDQRISDGARITFW
ncbi:MAG: MoaD/ThiS family protein [Bradymonadales bacterium]|nr:MoaD/ThiS family protein [Bradymonadales bacterium]